MDLPTYTNIWRIEKRLYKLYDLRLPMPLPLGQIVAFAGITVPYVLLLTLIGVPFNHNLIWLYVLPPWAITWLATRPVLENKRLPELLVSQVRYLGESRVWCRMAPPTEKDEITVVGRVWHARPKTAPQPAAAEIRQPAPDLVHAAEVPAWAASAPAPAPHVEPRHRRPAASRPQPVLSAAGRGPAVRHVPVPTGRPLLPNGPAAVPNGQAPVPTGQAPVPTGQTSLPTGQAPVPTGQAPLPNGQVPVPGGQAVGFVPQRARGGPAPVPGTRAHDSRPPERPGAGIRPPRREPRPVPPAGGGQQPPGWVTRARPDATISKPAEAAKPRIIEVAHAEAGQPPKRPVAEAKPPAPPAVASAQPLRPVQEPRPVAQPTPAASPAAPPAPAASPPTANPAVQPAARSAPQPAAPGQGTPPQLPVVTVVRGPGEERPAPVVERALSGPAGPRGRSWHDRITLVPGGGQGPGKVRPEEQEDRDKARARLPLPGPQRIVVLGCTSGAGQTVTALMTGRLLASLRAQAVAALDLNPGPGSLARRAQCAPAGTVRELLAGTMPAAPGDRAAAPTGGPGASGSRPAGRLEVIDTGADPESARSLVEGDFGRIGEYLTGRYRVSLVDPGAAAVGRVLAIADQLLLVAPASGDAPRAVSMTQEWLAQHDHGGLAAGAVMVVNGVSGRSMADVEKAEAIMEGRCRAIVRVPWDDQLGADGGPCAGAAALRLPVRQALTAVAGLLISGLAAAPAVALGDQK